MERAGEDIVSSHPGTWYITNPLPFSFPISFPFLSFLFLSSHLAISHPCRLALQVAPCYGVALPAISTPPAVVSILYTEPVGLCRLIRSIGLAQ
ncbi:hypothetical protein V8C37DRAFT_370664 [Trichoderma ceciliae]